MEMKKYRFEEQMRFADKSIMLIVLVPLLIVAAIGWSQKEFTVPGIIALCLILVAALMYSLRLHVIVDERGVSYKFFPFHTTFRLQAWKDTRQCEVIKVNAIGDFGGIGLRYKPKTVGYIINSRFGIKMERENGRFVVVSITKKEEAAAVINRYFSK